MLTTRRGGDPCFRSETGPAGFGLLLSETLPLLARRADLYHALGIPAETEYRDRQDQPRRLVDHGQPLVGLF